MKQIFLIITVFFGLIAQPAWAQAAKKLNVNFFKQHFVQIKKDTLLAAKYECSNELFNLFLNTNAGKAFHIDSQGWRSTLVFNEPFVMYYHRHQAYNNYPVVNINYAAATAFCAWLTDVYNNLPNRTYKKVIIRLPLVSEWEYAAAGGKPNMLFPWPGYYMRNNKGELQANFKLIEDHNIKLKNSYKRHNKNPISSENNSSIYEIVPNSNFIADGYFYTAPVNAFKANTFGLHQMAGNVSEFTLDTAVVKGGSFLSTGYYLRIYNNEQEVEAPSNGAAFIGFRPFMEILEK
jgi:formylglycine-generating enzyme required for sulfatase activity